LRDLVDFSLLDRLGKRHVACGPRSVAPEDYCAVVDWLFEVCLDMQLEDSTFVEPVVPLLKLLPPAPPAPE
jgi:hypothetical protein